MYRTLRTILVLFILFIALFLFYKLFIEADTGPTEPKEYITTDVIMLDGGVDELNLKLQDMNDFNIGDKVYFEYEEGGTYVEGVVIAKAGDKLSIKGDTIYNGDVAVFSSEKIDDELRQTILDYPISCNFQTDTGEGPIYDECIQYVLNDVDGSLQIIPSYKGDNAFTNNNLYLYIEDN